MNWDSQRIQAHLGGVQPVGPSKSPKPGETREGSGVFKDALTQAKAKQDVPNVTVSAHASQRLLQRGITLDKADLQKIDDALDRAAEKGAKESLFVLRDLALIVSVENRTVITALHGDSAKENVFTQIDSAVLL